MIKPSLLSIHLPVLLSVIECCALLLGSPVRSLSQSFGGQDRDRGLTMLKAVKEDIRKHYYDPTFHGIDLDERFNAAGERIKHAQSNGEIFGIIARVMLDFNDSHTFFIPPGRASRVNYGWLMRMVGDKCYVTNVRLGSDAEAKGLKPGDLVLNVDGVTPTRGNMWVYYYLYNALRPRPIVQVAVQSPGEKPRQLQVKARIDFGKKTVDLDNTFDVNKLWRDVEDEEYLNRHRFEAIGDELIIWKMPGFNLTKDGVDDYMGRVKKYKALILDLRGNSGGAVATLLRLIGNLFDHDVKVGDTKLRDESKPMVAKTRGTGAYQGQLIVLVDSESASASEIFARVVQLEKRGIVLGDRTSGSVMRSRWYDHQMGTDTKIFYNTSITDADLMMTDGNSLEKAGVIPDKLLLPTAQDLQTRKDPVLSYAASLVGVKLDPEKAGSFFPFRWTR